MEYQERFDQIQKAIEQELETRGELLFPWSVFPNNPPGSMGWRMGDTREIYMAAWGSWLRTLFTIEVVEYFKRNMPIPNEWLDSVAHDLQDEELIGIFEDADEETAWASWLAKHELTDFDEYVVWEKANKPLR